MVHNPVIHHLIASKEEIVLPVHKKEMGAVPNGASLRSFFATNILKLLIKNANVCQCKIQYIYRQCCQDFTCRVEVENPVQPSKKFAEKIALLKQKSFKQIGEIFDEFVPRKLLKPEQAGTMSRQRIF
ncbi:MAG: hypothetical protein ACOY3O_09860 [Thermodesulfobacteriota bacterium]